MLKYLFQKWTPERSCWWLVQDYYAEELKTALPVYPWEASPKSRAATIESVTKLTCWLEVKEPSTNCVVVMGKRGLMFHVGIYLGSGKVLHLPHEANGRVDVLGNLKKQHSTIKFYEYSK